MPKPKQRTRVTRKAGRPASVFCVVNLRSRRRVDGVRDLARDVLSVFDGFGASEREVIRERTASGKLRAELRGETSGPAEARKSILHEAFNEFTRAGIADPPCWFSIDRTSCLLSDLDVWHSVQMKAVSAKKQNAILSTIREANASLEGEHLPALAAMDPNLATEIALLRAKLVGAASLKEQIKDREPESAFSLIAANIGRNISPAREALADYLAELEGHEFRSFEEKKRFATSLNELLDRLGRLRVKCAGCGEPAILRAKMAGGAKNGTFQYDHFDHGKRRTHKGASLALPRLYLMPPRPDRRHK